MKEINKTYREFWKPIFGFFGLLNFKQVKKELSDYNSLLDMVPKVYMEITNGHISNPNTMAYEVIREYENYIEVNYIFKSEIEELLCNNESINLKDELIKMIDR